MILPVLFAQPSPDDPNKDNVALDDGLLQDNIPVGLQNVALDDAQNEGDIPKGLQKVELDLDDALFLEFEEEEPKQEQPPPPAPEPPAPRPQEDADKREQRFWHDKRVVVGGGGLFLFILAGVGYLLLTMLTGPEKKPADPIANVPVTVPAPSESEKTQQSLTSGADSTQLPVYNINLDPFHIEFNQNNRVRFLMCRVYLTDMTRSTQHELMGRETEVREIIYSYFKTLDFSVVEHGPRSKALTQGLQAAINEHVHNGSIGGVVLDEFVVR